MMQVFKCTVLLTSAVFLVGCGVPDPDSMFAKRFDSKIKKLAVLYSTYQARNNWTGPADDEAFREYIDGISESRLGRLEITKDEVDGLFRSERDGRPYRIRWGLVGGNGVPPKPVLFETEGSNGTYMVGFTNGMSKEFSKADYDLLWEGLGDDGSKIGFQASSRQ